jgi:hypothetical protein
MIRKRLTELEAALRGRQLIYFGTRGADAEPLLALPNLAAVFSLIAPLHARSVNEVSLEDRTQERVELDGYSLDLDQRAVITELRAILLHLFDRPCAVLPYRPCAFLSSAWFPRSDRALYLGVFHDLQACFEHKPWVERHLANRGVRVLPWRYWADVDVRLIAEWAAKQRLVLRSNRTDGGLGVRLIGGPEDLDAQWPAHSDGFLAAAPYLYPNIPLNVNACAFKDGAVTLHGPSLQVIGVPALTRRTFGYCGNDFASVGNLDTRILDDFEEMAVRTGQWLHENGYHGAFGIDALLHDGLLYLTEVNPRFQGSSLLSARIDTNLGRPNVFFEHAAALLGLAAPRRCPLRELARHQPCVSHLVLHNTSDAPVHVEPRPSRFGDVECRLEPAPTTRVSSDAITLQVIIQGPATSDGSSLAADARTAVNEHLRRVRRIAE